MTESWTLIPPYKITLLKFELKMHEKLRSLGILWANSKQCHSIIFYLGSNTHRELIPSWETLSSPIKIMSLFPIDKRYVFDLGYGNLLVLDRIKRAVATGLGWVSILIW